MHHANSLSVHYTSRVYRHCECLCMHCYFIQRDQNDALPPIPPPHNPLRGRASIDITAGLVTVSMSLVLVKLCGS